MTGSFCFQTYLWEATCLSLTMAGELATELTTRTMDMLRTTNLGILCLRKSTRV
uniref:Uncharacterized protein n=1 Tax=Brassica oleracea var. oleracea TaxID=109376 RepID=A0A0D3C5I8_BRAOL